MPEKKTPPPVDRPLSKAYLRQFAGWSTAYPPGQSEPNSLRHMENVWIDRNGAVEVRPGLHYLSYTQSPDLDPLLPDNPGVGLGLPVIGAPELFYTTDGSRALLFSVREANGTVGFRTILFEADDKNAVHSLEDADFTVPQTEAVLNFSADTTHVHYLQINNRILALSDNGEAARMFYVGGQKLAKKLKAISMPEWRDEHKLEAMHPDKSWIDDQDPTIRVNTVLNPSFEAGTKFWHAGPRADMEAVRIDDAPAGAYALELKSAPLRTNMIPVPLSGTITGWFPDDAANTQLQAVGPWLQVAKNISLEAEGAEEFYADSPRIFEEVRSNGDYRIAFDYDADEGAQAMMRLTSYAINGAELGSVTVDVGTSGGRWVSPVLQSATGATSMQVSLGGTGGAIRYANAVVCPDGQETEFFDGDTGADHYWTGTPQQSASVHHPPASVWIGSQPYPVLNDARAEVRADMWTDSASMTADLHIVGYTSDLDDGVVHTDWSQALVQDAWTTVGTAQESWNPGVVSANVRLGAYLERGERVRIDRVMVEFTDAVDPDYFDGATPSTAQALNSWQGLLTNLAHESPSEQRVLSGTAPLTPETPAANTLMATGGAEKNEYKMAFFYTFENEIGESAPSRITEIRMKRGWSQWIWETPNAAGEPSGTYTDTAELVADQIVVRMPQEVYDQAVAEGALRWNLYAMSWSDQQPVPVVAQLVEYRDIYTDLATVGAEPLPYAIGGWIQVTPSRKATEDDMLLPTAENRVNSSIPPSHRNGVVAGDRMILVGSPFDAATIAWSSNKAGQYTRFTPNRGGGRKTLTTGNLNLPYSVILWQNPQSVDTLTILCSDDNGRSTAYYMAPATVQGQSAISQVMGFEETTATPGTVAPYGAEVLNNALYRPLDRSLMKSTANNYNINHKMMSDMIANMWRQLQSKQWMMSEQLDNRLYYLVHNPLGELLEPHCKGNEIWVYDVAAENGHWSRFLIQGSALKAYNVGTRTYIGVSRPDGLFYLDEDLLHDDYADLDEKVLTRPIPWAFETNTQGANRAHDAWAHLQQVGVTFGNWRGSVRYGVRGQDMHGRKVHVTKVFSDDEPPGPPGESWDVDDALLIRRDMKEWFFYAESLTGQQGTGQIGIVQYRYTPTTVNIGYEFGSVETFEYGSNAGGPGDAYSRNGIPLPYMDYDRP